MSATTATAPFPVSRSAEVPLRPRVLLPALIYCGLCLALISSLGVLLIPTIASAQHVSLASAEWVLTINLLVGAVSTPVLGRIADGPHPRRVLVFMLCSVLAGSLVAATAASMPQLLFGRALQGLCYGIIPITITLARRHLPAHEVGRGVAALSVTAATGLGLGYPFTGIVAEHLDYRVAFWVAAGFSASALCLVPYAIPGSSPRERRDNTGVVAWLLRSAALGSGVVVPGGPVAAPAPAHPRRRGGTFDVVGTGTGVPAASDGLHFVYQKLTGDGTIIARVASVSNTAAWVKAGVMIRASLTANSAHGFMLASFSKGLAFQRRTATSGVSTNTAGAAATAPYWVRLDRAGDVFTASQSVDGQNWVVVGTDTIPMGATVYVGLGVSSHTTTATATATFDNVSISAGGSEG